MIPKRWILLQKLLHSLFIGMLCYFAIQAYRIQPSLTTKYHKEKDKREGKFRHAKEGKSHLALHQERQGISRDIWMQEGPLRRQFFLLANTADVKISIHAKENVLKEQFSNVKGWLQEELFWEISSTKERVLPKNGSWVYANHPTMPVPSHMYAHIIPMQKARFFEAARADWIPKTNTFIAYDAIFCLIEAKNHLLLESPTEGKTIAQGTAKSFTLELDKTGQHHIFSKGVLLQLPRGTHS